MTKEKVLPCPFCGCKGKVQQATNDQYFWIVRCTSRRCGLQPEIQHWDKAYALKQWNTRA